MGLGTLTQRQAPVRFAFSVSLWRLANWLTRRLGSAQSLALASRIVAWGKACRNSNVRLVQSDRSRNCPRVGMGQNAQNLERFEQAVCNMPPFEAAFLTRLEQQTLLQGRRQGCRLVLEGFPG